MYLEPGAIPRRMGTFIDIVGTLATDCDRAELPRLISLTLGDLWQAEGVTPGLCPATEDTSRNTVNMTVLGGRFDRRFLEAREAMCTLQLHNPELFADFLIDASHFGADPALGGAAAIMIEAYHRWFTAELLGNSDRVDEMRIARILLRVEQAATLLGGEAAQAGSGLGLLASYIYLDMTRAYLLARDAGILPGQQTIPLHDLRIIHRYAPSSVIEEQWATALDAIRACPSSAVGRSLRDDISGRATHFLDVAVLEFTDSWDVFADYFANQPGELERIANTFLEVRAGLADLARPPLDRGL